MMRLKLPPFPKIPYLDGLDRTVLIALFVAFGTGIALLIWFLAGSSSIEVSNRSDDRARSPITDELCERPDQRPIAIMLASDPEARPLSGIAQAELVIEIPVAPNGITRMMAVYLCTEPDEIGSIRSAREDFLGLVKGMDALYAHWGGEREALARLDAGELDNIDAMAYEGTVFYRKSNVPRPHNGFTTLEKIRDQAEQLDYSLDWDGSFWPHRQDRPRRSLGSAVGGVTISYPYGGRVRWTYDVDDNIWLRSRDGEPERDALDSRTARAGAIITIETESTFLREQYIDVTLSGSGAGTLFQDGMRRDIIWSRSDENAPFRFRYVSREPVALAPGPVWISVITEGIEVK